MKDKLIKGRTQNIFLRCRQRVNAVECKDDKRIKLSPAKISSLKFLLDLLHHLRLQLKKRWKNEVRRRVKKIKKKAFFSQEIVPKIHFFFSSPFVVTDCCCRCCLKGHCREEGILHPSLASSSAAASSQLLPIEFFRGKN